MRITDDLRGLIFNGTSTASGMQYYSSYYVIPYQFEIY